MAPIRRSPEAAAVVMPPNAAQLLHDAAAAPGCPPMWFVSDTVPAYPGKITARAFVADHHGGTQLPGVLVANTLDELHMMLPAGLTRWDRMPADPPSMVETWD